MTLAEAAERVNVAGGRVELRKDGELVVSLPPSVGWSSGGPWQAAKILYTARDTVVTCLRERRELPDAEVLPSGALAD